LYAELDATTSTAAKVAALRRYFDDAADADAAGRSTSCPAASRGRRHQRQHPAQERHRGALAGMLRIRRDKPLHEADSLQTLEGLLQG